MFTIQVSSAPLFAATEVAYPSDAPIWNVQTYGAVGNGVADDTQAFRDAISAALSQSNLYGSQPIIYVPNGTYLVSDTLYSKVASTSKWNGWRSGMWLQGESQAGAVIKLKNSCAGFTSAASPKAVIKTGSEQPNSATQGTGNQAFRHYIRNLTVDVGTGNAGAIGIDFLQNNRGGIFSVTVKSSDPARIGHTGIAMDRAWPGPGMLKDISVVGFETGVSLRQGYQYSMTVENLSLDGQRTYGVDVYKNTLFLRNVTSTNAVPAINLGDKNGHINLLGAALTGGASGNAAIRNRGTLQAEGVSTSGYGTAILDLTGGTRTVAAGSGTTSVDDYVSHGPYQSAVHANSESGPLGLAIEETPDFNTTNFGQWANVVSYGATVSNATNTDLVDDDRAGIQAAIDSGKQIVYLPRGTYAVQSPIIIRGNVRKIIGLCAAIKGSGPNYPAGGTTPVIRFDGTTNNFCVLQSLRLSGGTIEHNSSKALVLKSFESGPYYNTTQGTGKLFAEDYKVQDDDAQQLDRIAIRHGQSAWFRQVNAEFAHLPADYLRVEGGSQVWLFGMKTEGSESTPIHNDASSVELTGGFFYPTSGAPSVPAIASNDGRISASYKINGPNYSAQLFETRGGVSSTFGPSNYDPGYTAGNNLSLYSGSAESSSDWTSFDIGAVGSQAGSSTTSGGTFTVSGAGVDFGSGLQFVYRSMAGDGEMVARITSFTGSSSNRRAGIMVRKGLGASEPFVSIAMSSNKVVRISRSTSGGPVESSGTQATFPQWLRIVRTGSLFSVYYSNDGSAWTARGTVTLPVGQTVYVGFAACSGNTGTSAAAIFDSVQAP